MSDDVIRINPEVLEDDAMNKWHDWSEQLQTIKSAVPLNLTREDFSLMPGASALFTRCDDLATKLASYIGEGSDVFDSFANKLLETVKEYVAAEADSVEAIQRIDGEIEELDL